MSRIKNHFQQAMETLQAFMNDEKQMQNIEAAAQAMIDCIKNDGKILSCGNGGSHCDAMHFAEELTGRYRNHRPGIAAIAISDVSHISCVGNDYGYDQIFSRYIEAVGRKGDVLLGISSSGNSENVIKAIEMAKSKGMVVKWLHSSMSKSEHPTVNTPIAPKRFTSKSFMHSSIPLKWGWIT